MKTKEWIEETQLEIEKLKAMCKGIDGLRNLSYEQGLIRTRLLHECHEKLMNKISLLAEWQYGDCD